MASNIEMYIATITPEKTYFIRDFHFHTSSRNL